MMARRTKAIAIASWAFLSAMETFVNPRAHATAEMHFTVKAVLSSNLNPSSRWLEEIGNI
jgi:hypothetical protein